MPRWDAVLFDLDGTLIDSVSLIVDSFRHSFSACELPVPEAAQLLQGVGIPLAPHFARYVTDPDVIERLVIRYREYNLAHHDARVSAFPGVDRMLADVRASGARIGVVTSKNRVTTDRGLGLTGLAAFVDTSVTCDEVVHPKPHPEPVERALEKLRVEPHRAVFVGDSLHDLHSGRAAGVRTAAALWGPFSRGELQAGQPDYWVEHPESLCAALGLAILRQSRHHAPVDGHE
jgi:pyrophosphatase PpaX